MVVAAARYSRSAKRRAIAGMPSRKAGGNGADSGPRKILERAEWDSPRPAKLASDSLWNLTRSVMSGTRVATGLDGGEASRTPQHLPKDAADVAGRRLAAIGR